MNHTPHISIAPMMDWTDRHCRYFHRLLSPHVRLYTEMVTTGAIIHGDKDRHLRFNDMEHYVALQLGGSEPYDLATCANIGEDFGYDEINLNCGCPSERVQKGAFGACLMAEPDLVARGVEAMAKAVKIPVTVKCRIGIDDCDPYPFLHKFITDVSNAGCTMFVVHARKAWLKGLSPKENREVPPLDYDLAAKMKEEFPNLEIVVNGGIKTVEQVQTFLVPSSRRRPGYSTQHLEDPGLRRDDDAGMFDGVMIGREAYQNPAILLDLEREIFKNTNTMSAHDAVLAMIPYIEQQMLDHGTPINTITRHMIGMFGGMRGSRAWRRALSTEPHKDGVKPNFLENALLSLQAEAA